MGLLTSLTKANPGGAQPDIIFPVTPEVGGSVVWPSANRGYFLLVRVSRATSATGVSLYVATASGNLKVGLYDSDGTTLTQRALSAATAASGAGAWQDISFASPWPLAPGRDYYAFAAADNTTLSVLRTTETSAAVTLKGRRIYALDSAYASPPATQTIAGMTGGTAYVPVLALLTTG